MRQTTPTLSAQTQVLDPAHPSPRVGSLTGLETCPYELRLRFSESFDQVERVQLSEAVRMSLEDEINLMRKVVKAFGEAYQRVKDGEPFNKELGDVLNLLGLSCSRIAGLMRVQLLLQGPQTEGLLEDLTEAMNDFVEKMTAEEEKQND
ncbi:MAG: hypothetical protein AAGU15_08475 [Anaerolineaceae bacterium]|jgi:hypothetical protein